MLLATGSQLWRKSVKSIAWNENGGCRLRVTDCLNRIDQFHQRAGQQPRHSSRKNDGAQKGDQRREVYHVGDPPVSEEENAFACDIDDTQIGE